jgi:hypothetical protein
MGGPSQPQLGMTFWITLIFTFYLLPWELDPSQNMSSSPVLRLNARWEPGWFSLSGSHWEPYWKPTLVFSRRVRKAQHWLHLPRWGRNFAPVRQKKNIGLQGWSVQSLCRCWTTSANPHQWPGTLPSTMAPSLAATNSSW